MTQKSFFWNGASVGDAQTWTPAGGYHMGNSTYESPWETMCRALFNGTGNRGPLKGWLNELAVTGAAPNVSINTGAAIVYGLYYENDAALNVAVPSPSNDVRIDRIVVRRNWSAQTARITRIAGSEGGGAPALVQSPSPGGTGIYDIPLAQVSITTGGVITVTDEREYCIFSTVAGANSIAIATLPDGIVNFAARDLVLKSIDIGGSELLSMVSQFTYGEGAAAHYMTGASTWGAAASAMQGWRCSGTTAYGVYAAFRVPADYVPGTSIVPVLWLTDDWTGTTTVNIQSGWQAYLPAGAGTTETAVMPGSLSTTAVNVTSATNTVRAFALAAITGMAGGEMILYSARYSNAAGAEALLFTGLEFRYVGYA